ncbi:UNVERIFIED_CONTAM: TPD1 protein1 [Sesamum calycinum]|uniref:TPD1 protein1 n=1 Tax=Sesamum calycinum TaxID=2727403 RepID=A0AAW2R874_9LAMI
MMNTVHLFFYFFLVVIIVLCNIGFYTGNFSKEDENTTVALKPEFAYLNHRKLMLHGVCTKWDISISQSRYPTPGIPKYIVQIVNTCVSDCAPSNIHLHCGWFASARVVNPRTFKRLSFDDCLVNGGQPLKSSQSIRFTYANSFMYPLQFKSADFC